MEVWGCFVLKTGDFRAYWSDNQNDAEEKRTTRVKFLSEKKGLNLETIRG